MCVSTTLWVHVVNKRPALDECEWIASCYVLLCSFRISSLMHIAHRAFARPKATLDIQDAVLMKITALVLETVSWLSNERTQLCYELVPTRIKDRTVRLRDHRNFDSWQGHWDLLRPLLECILPTHLCITDKLTRNVFTTLYCSGLRSGPTLPSRRIYFRCVMMICRTKAVD
jgi:hypothetical protein